MSTPSSNTIKLLKKYQLQEINGYYIYYYLAGRNKSDEHTRVLQKMADDEKNHYEVYKGYTGIDVSPRWFTIFLYKLSTVIFGPTFAIKLLENNEIDAQEAYRKITDLPEVHDIIEDEKRHEEELVKMIREERHNYMGSIVLGLNDALVELTGALAGLTLALRNPELIALTGTITGITAAFSMAASEYLSTKSEETDKRAVKASIYTGIAYLLTVIILIIPFLLLENVFASLGFTLLGAISIIAVFNYYYSVIKDEKFSSRFTEMALLSFGVALFSFGIGFLLRNFFNVEV
ncbi:MAG: VIT1/CCC1 transporter family protein [Bacteroidota bacterium]